MDINDIRSLVMVLSLAAFLAIVRWAYSRQRAEDFAAAAALALLDEPELQPMRGDSTGASK